MNCSNLKKIINNDNVNLIKIYFGNSINSNIFSTKIDRNIIKLLVDNLKLKYTHEIQNVNRYYYEDKVMVLLDNKTITEKHELIDYERENLQNIHLQISGLNYVKISSSEFPCKQNYHLIDNEIFDTFKILNYLKILINKNSVTIEINKIPNLIKFVNEITQVINDINTLLKNKI